MEIGKKLEVGRYVRKLPQTFCPSMPVILSHKHQSCGRRDDENKCEVKLMIAAQFHHSKII